MSPYLSTSLLVLLLTLPAACVQNNPSADTAPILQIEDPFVNLNITDPDRVVVQMQHRAMATEWTFTVHGSRERLDQPQLIRACEEAFTEIDRLESKISDWLPDSDVSRINREAANHPVSVSPEVIDLLEECRRYHQITQGTFDPAIGPLVQLWRKFTAEKRVPAENDVAPLRNRLGFDAVEWEHGKNIVRFTRPGMALDFGGVGKGWALDRIAPRLREHGIRTALLDAGKSSILAIGAPPSRDGWTLRIGHPYNKNAPPVAEISIRDVAVSTSAVHELSSGPEGIKYSHIFDPRTGLPADAGVLSVTVIGKTGTETEALTKAFFITGRRGAEQYCAAHGDTRVILILADSGPENPVYINFHDRGNEP